jgi:hypothetical protein
MEGRKCRKGKKETLMASIQGNKIKYTKREILKAKKLLAKVIPFDVWLNIKDRSEGDISTYRRIVDELAQIAGEK